MDKVNTDLFIKLLQFIFSSASGEMKTFSCTGWSKTGCDTPTVTNREKKVFKSIIVSSFDSIYVTSGVLAGA